MNEPVTSWPLLVVDRGLHQRLAEALRERAMQLAFHDHVVEHVAAIVDRRIGDDRDVAGLRIDLDLGDVAAVGKGLRCIGRRLGVEVLGDLAALLHLGGARRESNSEMRRSVPTTSKRPSW